MSDWARWLDDLADDCGHPLGPALTPDNGLELRRAARAFRALNRERDEARAALGVIGRALTAATPVNPLELVEAPAPALKMFAQACGLPTECVECSEPLNTAGELRSQQCDPCYQYINGNP